MLNVSVGGAGAEPPSYDKTCSVRALGRPSTFAETDGSGGIF